MTLNRGICKTPILSLRSLMASYHIISLPQGSLCTFASLLVGGLSCECGSWSPSMYCICVSLLFICLLTKGTKILSSNHVTCRWSKLGQISQNSHWTVDGGHSWRIWAPWSFIKSSYELWHHFESRSQVVGAWNSSEHGSVNQNPSKVNWSQPWSTVHLISDLMMGIGLRGLIHVHISLI